MSLNASQPVTRQQVIAALSQIVGLPLTAVRRGADINDNSAPDLGGTGHTALNFTGGVIAWCVLVPLLIFFMGPDMKARFLPANAGEGDWAGLADNVWRFIVRPIAIGGMLVGAANTLFKMRKNLIAGLTRAFAEIKGGGPDLEKLARTERYMSSKAVFSLIGLAFLAMVALYSALAGELWIAAVAGVTMLIVGFFFATVSGDPT